jgi:hypothetical protein
MSKSKTLIGIACLLFASYFLLANTSRNTLPEDESVSSDSYQVVSQIYQNAHNCNRNDPAVKLINRHIPGVVAPGAQFTVAYTLANCGDEAWDPAKNFFIGTVPIEGVDNFGVGRLKFPSIVPINTEIQFYFKAAIPANAQGSYIFNIGILQESVKWLKPYIPPELIISGTTTKCNELAPLKDAGQDAQPALQGCIDALPAGGILEIDPGVYSLNMPISIGKSLTLLTTNTANSKETCRISGVECALFRALPTMPRRYTINSPEPMFNIVSPNVAIKNIIFDGNKANRNKGPEACDLGVNRRLFNIRVAPGLEADQSKFKFFHNASIRAACGSALFVGGRDNFIAYNYVANNGASAFFPGTNVGRWADGISLSGANNNVYSNVIGNNTDVNLILWGGKSSNVHYNVLFNTEKNQGAYASLMLNTYGQNEELSNFIDAEVTYNTIDCNGHCGFGIMLGEKPWKADAVNIFGGTVAHNVIRGATQGIMIDGAGRNRNPITVGPNRIPNIVGTTNSCGNITNQLAIAANSRVNLRETAFEPKEFEWRCTLPGCVFDQRYCRDSVAEFTPVDQSRIRVLAFTEPQQPPVGNTNGGGGNGGGGGNVGNGGGSGNQETTVVCGNLDSNNDGKIDLSDLASFVVVYGQFSRAQSDGRQLTCSDSPITTGCGGNDTNNDKLVNLLDFAHFAKNWYINVPSCVI